MKPILIRILLTVTLTALGCWTVFFNWPQRAIRQTNYTFSDEEAQRLKAYPKAQYEMGNHALLLQQPERAIGFFRQTVSQDPLFIDAWLRLAETETTLGDEEKARNILTFITDLTNQVVGWKWEQMLLAQELGMQDRIYRNTNYLLSRKVLVQDVLQLLHTHLGGNTSTIVAVLEPINLAAYLDWLMRWGMTDDSLTVWQAMTANAEPEKEIALRYAHFLLKQKRITPSVDIWQKYTGSADLTNPGFEKKISGLGYDWRHWMQKDDSWSLKRVSNQFAEGNRALRITFNGRENVSFHHLYQIFTVEPQTKYRLTYVWKSRGITTDQGPFVEIYGYEKGRLYQAGPMIRGTHGWHEESIAFETSADSLAAVVRLRRRTSKRFDAKIRGVLWIDDFQLEKIEMRKQRATAQSSPLSHGFTPTKSNSFQATR